MSISGPYSSLKVIHHRDRLDALSRGEVPAPVQVQLYISDLCQHDCSFCAFRWPGYASNQLWDDGSELASFGHNNPNRLIPYPKIVEILDDCQEMGVKAIQFTGGGEPTVHPRHREVFQAALDRGLEIALVSNGTIFREAGRGVRSTVEILLDAAWVRFSLDAGTPDTYAAVRRVNALYFGALCRNVQSLTAARNAQPGSKVVVGIGFVLTRENWREVVDATRLARELGCDNIRISAVFQPDDAAYFSDFHEQAAALCREAEELATPAFAVVNRFGDRLADLAQRQPDYERCGYQHFNTVISASQEVWRCCNTAYNELGLLGSLKEQRFAELWQSDEVRRKMLDFDARQCPRCMFNGINRTIHYARDKAAAEHVNFV